MYHFKCDLKGSLGGFLEFKEFVIRFVIIVEIGSLVPKVILQ